MARLLRAGSQIIRAGAVYPWETGNGTIPLANVVYAVKLPAIGAQVSSGLPLNDAWTIAARTNLSSVPTDAYVFDSASGRLVLGVNTGNGYNGFRIASSYYNITLFTTGDHTYMLVSDGTSVQAYRDGVAVGAAVTNGVNISSTTRWRSANFDTNASTWTAALPGAWLGNIALSAPQIAGLHTSLMALPAS